MKDKFQDLNHGKDLEKNLPLFYEWAASNNLVYGGIQFVMTGFLLCESWSNGFYQEVEGSKRLVLECGNLIGDFLINGKLMAEEACFKLDRMRHEALDRVEVLMEYSDRLDLYDGVLKRIEFRFKKGIEIDREAAIKEVLELIFACDDKQLFQANLQVILGLLPVRMTKGHFFDLVKQNLLHYNGLLEETADRFLFLIESNAGVKRYASDKKYFCPIGEAMDRYETIQYSTLSEAEYKDYTNELEAYEKKIAEAIDFYKEFIEMLNPLYLMILNLEYAAKQAVMELDTHKLIISVLASHFCNPNPASIPDDFDFSYMEGKIEAVMEQLQIQAGTFEQLFRLKERVEQMDEKGFEVIRKSVLICSSSQYFSLDRKPIEKIADLDYLDHKFELFQAFLLEKFNGKEKLLNRMRMAAVLKSLPDFFKSIDEIYEYVQYSINHCGDMPELEASIILTRDFLEGGYNESVCESEEFKN